MWCVRVALQIRRITIFPIEIAILWISLIFRHIHSEYICICMYCIDSTCQASILSRKLSPILVLLLQLVQTDLNWSVTNHSVAALGIVQKWNIQRHFVLITFPIRIAILSYTRSHVWATSKHNLSSWFCPVHIH